MALCALVGSKEVLLKVGATKRTCQGTCERQIWVSPSTLAMGEGAQTMCNDCGKAALMAQSILAPDHKVELRYAGLKDDTPDDRRRRNELEARGFVEATPEEIEEIRGPQ